MESFSASLQARSVFKFIVGITNFDVDDIRFLTQVYTLAGADIIDVAAIPDVVAATRRAMSQVRQQLPTRAHTAKTMASLALERDPHVENAEMDVRHWASIVPANTSDLLAAARSCLEAGADMVELHASDSEDGQLREAVEALSPALTGRYLSVCLGTEGLRAPREAIRQAGMVRAIHGPRTMVQAEGVTLTKDGSPGSSVQGLALAQALLANTTAYVVVAGGANYWTRDLADLLGVPTHGIASGSYARNLVEGFRAGGPAAEDLPAAVAVARRFACHAKGVPEHVV